VRASRTPRNPAPPVIKICMRGLLFIVGIRLD
jgi:hypothetical protein